MGAVDIRWETLDETNQLALARAALDRAINIVASRAEALADEMAQGTVADQGGVDALRLFASLTRCASEMRGALFAQMSHGQVGHS